MTPSMDVIAEIFSLLPVKSLLRFSCVNKSFDALISDPYFVQMRLNKSKRIKQLALISQISSKSLGLTFPKISRLLENSLTTIPYDHLPASQSHWSLVGSWNGLLCLNDRNAEQLYLWNPARKSEFYLNYPRDSYPRDNLHFSFGYDNSTETYRVVAFRVEFYKLGKMKSKVKIFSLGGHSWRRIKCFPVIPLYKFNGVYLSGIINWLALRDHSDVDLSHFSHSSITIENYVILSLDLSTEANTQLLLPRGFDKVPHYMPKLVVLRDNLCFCHDFEETYLVIWQMKDFGVQESWIQLFKISYYNFSSSFERFDLLPLYLSQKGDALILTNDGEDEGNEAFIYNCKDNRVEQLGITDSIYWSEAQDYVESLVWPHCKCGHYDKKYRRE